MSQFIKEMREMEDKLEKMQQELDDQFEKMVSMAVEHPCYQLSKTLEQAFNLAYEGLKKYEETAIFTQEGDTFLAADFIRQIDEIMKGT